MILEYSLLQIDDVFVFFLLLYRLYLLYLLYIFYAFYAIDYAHSLRSFNGRRIVAINLRYVIVQGHCEMAEASSCYSFLAVFHCNVFWIQAFFLPCTSFLPSSRFFKYYTTMLRISRKNAKTFSLEIRHSPMLLCNGRSSLSSACIIVLVVCYYR